MMKPTPIELFCERNVGENFTEIIRLFLHGNVDLDSAYRAVKLLKKRRSLKGADANIIQSLLQERLDLNQVSHKLKLNFHFIQGE